MFEVVITEIVPRPVPNSPIEPEKIERYRQTVDALDIRAVMAAVNQKPRKPRVRQEKS